MASLEKKVVLITGASSGIGRVTALSFARAGARLMLAARREGELAKVCEESRATGAEVEYLVTDVADEAAVERLIAGTLTRYGRVDVLVNNAGYGVFEALADTSSEDFHRLMEVNLFGVFYACKAVLPAMLAQKAGHIINISSMGGKRVFRGVGAAYNASKFAAQGLTEALRMEMLGTPIAITALCPVVTSTEFYDPVAKKTGTEARLHGPVQTPEKVAAAIVAVAKKPKAEVLMIGWLRYLLALNALVPAFVDRLVKRLLA